MRQKPVASPSLLDLLPWDQLVAEGVLRNVDGGLVTSFSYRGPDLEAATPEMLEALSQALAKAFQPLGDGWMVQVETHRLPAPGYPEPGAFPDPVTRALDEERRRSYESAGAHFASRAYLTLTYRPPLEARFPTAEAEEKALADFEGQVAEVAGVLSTQVSLDKLSSRELLEYLHACLTFRHQRLALPPYPVSLEALFGSGDLEAGREVRFAETEIVPVAVAGFPSATVPGSLDFLGSLPSPHHASVRYLPLDPWSAKKVITGRRTRWVHAGVGVREILGMILQAASGGSPFRNRFAPAMAQDADDALLDLEKSQSGAGYLTLTLLFFDQQRARALEQAEAVVAELRNRGFVAWIETWNAPSAFLGALPGCGGYNVRRPLFLARSFLDLAPTTSVWTGSARHPSPKLSGEPAHVVTSTSGSTPFYLNLAEADVQHALIVGPTGAGKSVLVNLLVSQYLRFPRARVFVIDKGWSLLATARAAGGAHFAFSPEGDSLALSPLAHLDSARDRQRAREWLEDLVSVQGIALDAGHRGHLGRALELLAATSNRTLTNFRAKVQEPALRQALEPYTASGPYGYLFDGEGATLHEGPLQVFEMEEVLALKEQAVTPLVLHLFSEIERRLDGRPTLLVVEEALGYLGETLWARKLRTWLYELRKKNAGVVFVAQTLSALLSSSLKDALLESCPTRLFLPNPSAREEAADSYRAFGLNDRQLEILAGATSRREYYAVTPSGSRLFSLDLSPGALALFGLAGPEGRRTVESWIDRHGPAWVAPFLREEGAPELADLVDLFSKETLG